MANITADTYLDGGTSRTAGETMAISNGAKLTIRTDSRIHANAPASFTGSMGSVSFTGLGGEYIIDARNVRWLAYNTGSGNVPAIGTTVTQGGVSGYLLGVWSTASSAPTAVGSAMPTSGFIKFREVTGGAFAAGALTGIGASATTADVQGWIEVVYDAGTNIVVPRVGKMTSRGAWFELGTTNGSVGQQLIIPTSSSAQTNNYPMGAWVETASGSGVYEFWPGLNGSTNGWGRTHLGFAEGYTDARGKFLKSVTGGILQFGETATLAATYASLAAQAGTYADIAVSGTYTWANDIVTVDCGGTTHLLDTGQQTGLDFTSGSAVDNTFTVTVLDAYRFTVPYSGSGTGGNVTVRPGVTVTFTAHGLNHGEQVYCDFTSGTGVDGTYTIYSIDSANAYKVAYPHTAALTGGNVSCLHTLTITYTAHGHAVGNEVYCDFTSGGAADGKYIIKTVATNTFNVNYPHSAAIATSNVTLRWTIGHVPPTGCKVRIPNILFAECATASRATNSVPNATAGTRPEITTTNAGAIDLEYIYALSINTYTTFGQAYSMRLYHSVFQDALQIAEVASALDLDNVGIGMYGAQDTITFLLTSNFAGGTVKNVVAARGNTPGTTDHCMSVVSCKGITFTNVQAGIVQFVRSTGIVNVSYSSNLTFDNLAVYNANVGVVSCIDITFNDTDYNDRYIGHTNVTTAYVAIAISAGSDGIVIDGMTFGKVGTITDCHPRSGVVSAVQSSNIKVRNIGTKSNPIDAGTFAFSAFGMAGINNTSGNNDSMKFQKIYLTRVSGATLLATVNSDKNVIFEHVVAQSPYSFATASKGALSIANANLNSTFKNTSNQYITAGQTSVYGTHWLSAFMGLDRGILFLAMNEPTAETINDYTLNAGTVKFTSAGGVAMYSVNDQATWTMPYFLKGFTSFANITPTMSGGTIGNYTIEYQIDTGSGWNGSWLTLNTTNLTAETISASTGFKLKIRITTTTGNSTDITYLRVFLNSTSAAQENYYPLDLIDLTVTGIQPGSDVVIYSAGTTTVRQSYDSIASTSITYQYETTENIDIGVFKAGYIPLFIRNYALGTSNASLPVAQVVDRAYLV